MIGAIGICHDLIGQQPVVLSGQAQFRAFDHPAYQKLVMSWYIAGGNDREGDRLVME